jgi:hypothetical protein
LPLEELLKHLGAMSHTFQVPYSDEKVANRNVRGFGWEIAHAAVTRLPPISLYAVVARTAGYTFAAKVCDLSLVQGPFSAAPCRNLPLTIRNFCIDVVPGVWTAAS